MITSKPALRHTGCRIPTHRQLSHYLSLDRWPLMAVAQSPGPKGSPAGPPQDDTWCQEGRGRGREASATFLDGEPQEPLQDKNVPQVDTGQGRAGQGKPRPQLESQLESHDCSVLLQVSQLLGAGGGVGWWGRGRGRGRGGGK